MLGSVESKNRSSSIIAFVAVTSASVTVVMYRWFWYKTRNDGCDSGSQSSPALGQQQQYGAIRIKPPLRNVTPIPGEQSRIVYLTGIDKQTSEEELVGLFSSGGRPPVEIDASEISFRKGGGRAWALYSTANDARRTIESIHGKTVYGCILCARLEWGVDKDGKRITDKTAHTAILRGIQRRRGTPKKKQAVGNKDSKTKNKSKWNNKSNIKQRPQTTKSDHITQGDISSSEYVATYSHNSISIGEIEYPFPSGIYSTKLIQKLSSSVHTSSRMEGNLEQHRREQDTKLLHLLSDVSIIGCGSVHRYAKEISETFAMIDALERGIKLRYGVSSSDLQQSVVCYCLGDGKFPIGAAAFELFLPKGNQWKFVSIDPLLPKNDGQSVGTKEMPTENDKNTNVVSVFHDRIEMFSGISQDYLIEKASKASSDQGASTFGGDSVLSIAVACHSHAPLEEFWERMPKPKLCVAMPCCAQYSELPKETPILEYDNYEVYSPKRKIKIFASRNN